MKKGLSTGLKSIFLIISSLILCILSGFISRKLTPFDMNQLFYIGLVLYPIITFITGILSQLMFKKVYISSVFSTIPALMLIVLVFQFNIPVYSVLLFCLYELTGILGSLSVIGIKKMKCTAPN